MEHRNCDSAASESGAQSNQSGSGSARSTPNPHRQSPCSVGSGTASRQETPGPMPKYKYSRDDLVRFRESPHSHKRPDCLASEHDADDGWDPEKWFRSFDLSREESPSTTSAREKKRQPEVDKEPFKRKPSADPKGRLKEEEEEGLGIVLSPQRRSFGTGCHVTAPTPPAKELGARRSGSPNDLEGRDRRGERRIGSGRIIINREHDIRDARGGRFDRDIRDRGDVRDRDVRERDTRERDNRDRDFRGGDRDFRDRDHEDHRGFHRVIDRFGGGRSDRDRDRRDFGDRRGYHDNRRGYRRQDHEEEPEWFTGGPSSQTDFIELHGFEGPRQVKEDDKEKTKNRTPRKKAPSPKPEQSPVKEVKPAATDKPAEAMVQNGEPAIQNEECLREEFSDSQATLADDQNFDFTEFLKSDNIPGLALEQDQAAAVPEVMPSGSSRFSQFFQPGSQQQPSHNHDNSMSEEFSYLDDLMSSKSPAAPSPPPAMNPKGLPQLFSPITAASGAHTDQQMHMLQLLQKAQQQQIPPEAPNTNAMEANLRAILMGSTNNAKVQSAPPPAMPAGGRVMTAAEFEANLGPKQTPPPPAPLPVELFGTAPMAYELEKRALGVPHHGRPMSKQPMPNAAFSASLGVAATPPPKVGSMMTVWELEAAMKDNQAKEDPSRGHHHTPEQQRIAQQLHQQQAMKHQDPSGGMTAFNKLIGMMEASGSLPQTPKMPKRADGRPLSPLSIPNMNKVEQNPQQNPSQDLIQLQKMLMQKANMQQQQQQQQQHQQQQHQQQQQQQQQHQQQQQQQAQLQAKIQAQAKMQDQIMKIMKGQLKPPASPFAPGITLSSSPHCPSPAMPQAASLLQQPPASPRAPSPIMFGSQPPMHLTAPSPVHPSPLSPTQTLSPTSALQHPGLPQRVPSPQELIVHTQAIMQNALIKKQLEDQKERYRKRQQETPFPIDKTKPPQMVASTPTSTPTSSTCTLGKVAPAFMPTSVIRKMASEKADEAAKKMADGTPQSHKLPPPILKIVKTDSMEEGTVEVEDHSDSGFQGTPVTGSEPSILVSPPSSDQKAEICVSSIEGDGSSVNMNLQQRLAEELKARVMDPHQQQQLARRALVGTGGMQHHAPPPMPPSPSHPTSNHPGRAIVKNSIQPGLMSPPSQAERSIPGVKVTQPVMFRSPGTVPVHPVVQASPLSPNTNAILMQRMMQPRGPLPPMSAAALCQFAAMQQQQHAPIFSSGLTPAQAAVVAGNSRSVPTSAPASYNPGALGGMGRTVSPLPPQQAFGNRPPARQDLFNNGPRSAVIPNAQMAVLMGHQQSGDTNLTKWFGSDMLKQQLPNMPPLPSQGQRVLTVDEIERR